MYISKHPLLNSTLNIKSEGELSEFLREVAPDFTGISRTLRGKPNYSMSRGAFLCFLGSYLSLPSLGNLLGEYFLSSNFKSIVGDAVRGNFFKPLLLQDMNSRKAYTLTKAGYNNVAAVPEQYCFSDKFVVRRTKGLAIAHTYGVGLSVLAALAGGVPFACMKEVMYTRTLLTTRKDVFLRVDAVLSYRRHDNSFYKVYVEQDTGTESLSVLLNKIVKYNRQGLLRSDNSCIAFSFHVIGALPCADVFSVDKLRALRDRMSAGGYDDLCEYYTSTSSILSNDDLLFVKRLMSIVGLCVPYVIKGGERHIRGVEDVDFDTLLDFDPEGGFDSANFFAKPFVLSFTLTDLERYINELVIGRNPYRLIEYTRGVQIPLLHRRKYGLWRALGSSLKKGIWNSELLFELLHGYSVFTVCSILFHKISMLYLPGNHFFVDSCCQLLEKYYPGIGGCCREYGGSYLFSGVGLRFKYFAELPGVNVAIEHVGYDIGGFVRAYAAVIASKVYRSSFPGGKPLHLILVCEDEAEILRFCEEASYTGLSAFDINEPFSVYFFVDSDICGVGSGVLKSGRCVTYGDRSFKSIDLVY